jgi:Spy/CpxP family protein refolding chaperone
LLPGEFSSPIVLPLHGQGGDPGRRRDEHEGGGVMFLRTNRWMIGPLGLALALTAGCGSPPSGVGAVERPQAAPNYRVLVDTAMPADHGQRFMAQLRLSAGQKTRLAEIKADWPTPAEFQLSTATDQFKGLMQADEVDQPAVENLLTLVLGRYNQMVAKRVLLVEKARGVLTATQRQKVAVAVLAHVGATDSGSGATLNLTPEQRAAFAWTKGMTKARKKAALASYMLTGDEAALKAAWTIDEIDAKVARMSEALASMTFAQRKALIKHMDEAHKDMHDSAPATE